MHTPGPWKFYWSKEEGEANCGVFAEPREGQAYSICRAPRYESKEQWEANARLIAAAPDLLEALNQCRGCDLDPKTREILEAAIKKATE